MSEYPTKRDTWLIILLWLLAGFFLYLTLTLRAEQAAPWMKFFSTLYCLLLAVFLGLLIFLAYRTTYELDADHLTIKVGPFSKSIPLTEITEAYPTRNPLSAPAWSLDRVRIKFTSSRFGALISPQRKEEFLQELAERAEQLVKIGNRVVLKERADSERRNCQ